MRRVNHPEFAEYLKAIVGDDSGRQTAQRTGTSESAVSRWKAGTHIPDPRQAVTVARAYGRNPLEALIAAGYLTNDEASIPIANLEDVSDIDIARELVRRARTPGHDALTQPLDADHPAMNDDA